MTIRPVAWRGRRRLVTLVLALAALGGVVTVGWAYACHRLQVDLFAMLSEAGWDLRAARVGWSGWPVRAGVELEGASLAGGGVTWRAERARTAIDVRAPRWLVVETGGAQAVAAAGLGEAPFTTTRLRMEADLWGEATTAVRIDGLRGEGVAAEEAAAQVEPAGDRAAAAATGLVLPAVGRLDDVRLVVNVVPPVPALWSGVRAGGSGVASAAAWRAAAWRAAQGRVIVGVQVPRAGPLAAHFTAVIGLDADLQPEGDGEIEAEGVPAWLDGLAQSGTITAAEATAAKAVVGLLAAPSPGRAVRLPVSLRQGRVSVAGVPLLRLPPAAW